MPKALHPTKTTTRANNNNLYLSMTIYNNLPYKLCGDVRPNLTIKWLDSPYC